MHQETWVHRHLQACNFVFDPGWRRQSRHWCIHQLFAGRFQDNGAYRKWRVHLRRGDDVYWKCKPLRRAVRALSWAVPPLGKSYARRVGKGKVFAVDELLLGRPDATRRVIVSTESTRSNK